MRRPVPLPLGDDVNEVRNFVDVVVPPYDPSFVPGPLDRVGGVVEGEAFAFDCVQFIQHDNARELVNLCRTVGPDEAAWSRRHRADLCDLFLVMGIFDEFRLDWDILGPDGVVVRVVFDVMRDIIEKPIEAMVEALHQANDEDADGLMPRRAKS